MSSNLNIQTVDEEDRRIFLGRDIKSLIRSISLMPKPRAQFNRARGNILESVSLSGKINENPLFVDAYDLMSEDRELGFDWQPIPGETVGRTAKQWEKALMLSFLQRSLKKMSYIEGVREQEILDIREEIDDELTQPKSQRDQKTLKRLRRQMVKMKEKSRNVLRGLTDEIDEDRLRGVAGRSMFDKTFLQEYLSHEVADKGAALEDFFKGPSYRRLQLTSGFRNGIVRTLGIEQDEIDEAVDAIRNKNEQIAPRIDDLIATIRPRILTAKGTIQ